MHIYAVYYRYKLPTDKAPGNGAVKMFRINASNLSEAQELVKQYACYPHIVVLNVKQVD